MPQTIFVLKLVETLGEGRPPRLRQVITPTPVSRGAVRSAASSYAAMRMVAGSRSVLVIVWEWHIGLALLCGCLGALEYPTTNSFGPINKSLSLSLSLSLSTRFVAAWQFALMNVGPWWWKASHKALYLYLHLNHVMLQLLLSLLLVYLSRKTQLATII